MIEFRKPPIPRHQITLWAERLDDAISCDHPVRLLEALFSTPAFDEVLRGLEEAQRQWEGQPGYSPRILGKVVLYCHVEKIRSSRRIAMACMNRLDVKWLAEGQTPDYSTFTRFFNRHRKSVKKLLRATIEAARDAGMVTLEQVAVDGTFVEANASRNSVLERDRIQAEKRLIDQVIEQMMKEHEQNDQREDSVAREGGLIIGDDTQREDQRKRAFEEKRQRLMEAAEAIERREQKSRRADLPAPNPIASITDPDSRHMKDKEHRRKPNYNVQMAVDTSHGIVVATEVTDEANDMEQLAPMLEQIETQCGQLPGEALFDAGYHTTRVVSEVEKKPTTLYVSDPDGKSYRTAAEARAVLAAGGSLSLEQIKALPRDSRGLFQRACFVYDEDTDTYRCPSGSVLTRDRRRTKTDRVGQVQGSEYATSACSACGLAPECTKSKSGRRILRTEFEEARMRMLERTSSPEGKKRSSLRSQTVEPRIGELKSVFGLRKFLRRGAEKVAAELDLVVTAMNLGKLIRNARVREKIIA